VDRRVSFVTASALPEHPNPCPAVTNISYPTDCVLHRRQEFHEIVDVKFIHHDFTIGPRGLDCARGDAPCTGGSQLGDSRVWRCDCSTGRPPRGGRGRYYYLSLKSSRAPRRASQRRHILGRRPPQEPMAQRRAFFAELRLRPILVRTQWALHRSGDRAMPRHVEMAARGHSASPVSRAHSVTAMNGTTGPRDSNGNPGRLVLENISTPYRIRCIRGGGPWKRHRETPMNE